ncbi:hypothetical protein [Pseudolactococcus reticulitermitis]|uniref:Tandem five-TM protein n=1 Tax=Pseudolactococcus reticulitermitis TaxID=2025039 RepID=A0A224XG22_9LACT|nr:hypothetical protein [Lactococcus reticulitermitis]GAX48473.1 hypothetical protein RsY01_2102 [Lactococcus reticulitermitis]
MVDPKYNRYRIENLERISSRFYLIRLHGKSYVIDFYDVKKIKNFFPFSTLYNNRENKTWGIYDITNHEKEFSSMSLTLGNLVPKSNVIFSVLILFPLILMVFLLLPFFIAGILILMYMVFLGYIIFREFESNKILLKQLNNFANYQLLLVEERRKRFYIIGSNTIAIGISIFYVMLILISIDSSKSILPVLCFGIWFGILLSNTFGRLISGVEYIPDETKKYKIIEKKEI